MEDFLSVAASLHNASFLFLSTGLGSPSTSMLQFSSVAQLYPTLCDPMNRSTPGLPVHEILQAEILGWVTISYARGSS